jgi:hypothetical protein
MRPVGHDACPPKDELRFLTPVLLLALAALSFFWHARPNKDRLVNTVTERLREGSFDRLYDESADLLHRNVTRERFVRRMREAVARMRAIDPGLNFKRDAPRERMLADFGDESILMTAAERLEGQGGSASVLIDWDGEGNFHDLSVLPGPETPQAYAVLGVGAHQYHMGDKALDW